MNSRRTMKYSEADQVWSDGLWADMPASRGANLTISENFPGRYLVSVQRRSPTPRVYAHVRPALARKLIAMCQRVPYTLTEYTYGKE